MSKPLNEMTLSEFQQLKKKLELDLERLLITFANETGSMVTAVTLNTYIQETIGSLDKTPIKSHNYVNTTVMLGDLTIGI
jgi:hypothetical protein